jgi:alkanesulfonate monooxygenase SsuD/methylene tetrahydromethanopterin reductase-like flavin-dependent oxidoreductase (luciferase family)
LVERVRPGVLTGSIEQVTDRIGRYVDAGVDQVNLALRAPFDVESLDRFAEAFDLAARHTS